MAQIQITRVDEVNQAFQKLRMPRGDEPSIILTHNDGKRVHSLDHSQQNYLGQLVTQEVFGQGSGERYSMVPVASAYRRVHSDMDFRQANIDGWFHNEELIGKGEGREGWVMPHPIAKPYEGGFRYEGDKIPVKIQDTAPATLRKAGLFPDTPRTGERRVWGGSQYFEDSNHSGMAAVWSYWGRVVGCFIAGAYGPSFRISDGFAGLQKSPISAFEQPVQIGRRELDELKKYADIGRRFEKFVGQTLKE